VVLTPSITTLTAFAALAVALAMLWTPRVWASPRAARAWTMPFAVALAAALAGGIVDVRGVLVLLAFAVACRAANRAAGKTMSVVAHAAMLVVCGGLMLHVLPGFDNPVVLDRVVLSPGGVPYTKYLDFDKAVTGLFLLGVYAPTLTESDHGPRPARAFAWRFALTTGVVIALSLAAGFVRWDPKAPAWLPPWACSLLFFTVLPEEALFRGVVQTAVERWAGLTERATIAAILLAAALFGLAHAGGGPTYVMLATVAGAGYGWIFARTRSISAAIAAHLALDVVHFVFFTYPALAVAG
jgi:membrane protease YdiL (CAAX protease family)